MRDAKEFHLPLTIIIYPSSLLVAKNQRIADYTDDMAAKVKEMFRLMYAHEGVGLAAPQVGWNVQLFILNLSGKPGTASHEQVIFNPTMVTNGRLEAHPEGCLSFPKITATIERATACRIVGRCPQGLFDKEFHGFGAQAAQHEMDHLEGILFHERMNKADRDRNGPAIQALLDHSLKKR